MIPFAVTVPEAERDPDLAEKLKAEWSGILAWLIEGCLEWQTEGLRPPEAVRAATEAYLSAEELLTSWLDEACEREPARWEPSTALFSSWSNWATRPASIPATANALRRPSRPGALRRAARGAEATIPCAVLTDCA